jgi:16S rRNA G966 N2-methylase RsmD
LLRDLLGDAAGAVEGTLLDVGSGVGGLSFELLERGVERAIAVDPSAAYLAAAAQGATRCDRLRAAVG